MHSCTVLTKKLLLTDLKKLAKCLPDRSNNYCMQDWRFQDFKMNKLIRIVVVIPLPEVYHFQNIKEQKCLHPDLAFTLTYIQTPLNFLPPPPLKEGCAFRLFGLHVIYLTSFSTFSYYFQLLLFFGGGGFKVSVWIMCHFPFFSHAIGSCPITALCYALI